MGLILVPYLVIGLILIGLVQLERTPGKKFREEKNLGPLTTLCLFWWSPVVFVYFMIANFLKVFFPDIEP